MGTGTFQLNDSVQYLKGVGPRRLSLLEKLGIRRMVDLLFYFPRDYQDRRKMITIDQLVNDGEQSIEATIESIQERVVRKKLFILTLVVSDGTGRVAIPFFNQRFLKKHFKVGERYLFTGKVQYKYGLQMTQVVYEKLSEDLEENRLNTGRIVPLYPLTEGLTQRQLRRMIKHVIDQTLSQVVEILPQILIERHGLMERCMALREIHFPKDSDHMEQARRRLIYEEFFVFQVALIDKKNRTQGEKENGLLCMDTDGLVKHFDEQLPFELTKAQRKVMQEIRADMQSSRVMMRLLQGDVGSGKTIVAVYAMMLAIQNGYQVAFMAPTEILATQHFAVLMEFLDVFQVQADLLVGSTKKRKHEAILQCLQSGEIHAVVGTHALIQDDVNFNQLGLVIIDEQHKFGVMQRSQMQKKGLNPHILVMTATPIPRTLSMTVYGELDVSIIDQLPMGRKPIKTFFVTEAKREGLYDFVRKEIIEGRQVYFVYPLVEISEKLDLKAVEERYEHLCQDVFTDFRLGMLHGRMKAAEKEQTMTLFKQGDLDILVSTTVIEVGINVPNATVMLIEDASRFGLAQLHQLRGRVGRGEHQSYCILIGAAKSPESRERMKVMCDTNDGFKIAEADLQIRGPGEFFGFRQSGLPELRLGSLLSDFKLMEQACQDTLELFGDQQHLVARAQLLRMVYERYGHKIDIAGIA